MVTVPDANGHEYVDLGLPSGTLWATMNVGASSLLDYGYFFAWGDVTGYSENHEYDWDSLFYSWSHYSHCRGNANTLTKYCTNAQYGDVDNRTELELSDDAAHYHWGGSWRMPSTEQFVELYNECTWTHSEININDKHYCDVFVFSSKKNNNSIFLINRFYTRVSSSYHTHHGIENYWSRSLYEYNNYAYALGWDEDPDKNGQWENNTEFLTETLLRYRGRCVRPVLSPE